jgi:hypothetical protein
MAKLDQLYAGRKCLLKFLLKLAICVQWGLNIWSRISWKLLVVNDLSVQHQFVLVYAFYSTTSLQLQPHHMLFILLLYLRLRVLCGIKANKLVRCTVFLMLLSKHTRSHPLFSSRPTGHSTYSRQRPSDVNGDPVLPKFMAHEVGHFRVLLLWRLLCLGRAGEG